MKKLTQNILFNGLSFSLALLISLFFAVPINNPHENIVVENTSASKTNVETRTERIISRKIDKKFIGCWSSSSGRLLRIDESRVFYGFPKSSIKKSPKPIYFVVEDSYDENLILLKLIDRPQFAGLDNYITLKFYKSEFADFNVDIKYYDNYQSYLEKENGGFQYNWVPDDCKKWYPKWFDKYYESGD
jgi:hypothetical protein